MLGVADEPLAVSPAVVDCIAGNAARVDADRLFPSDGLAALADDGALGLLVPERAGGSGESLGSLAKAAEAVGGACASTGMIFLMHSVTAATIAGGGGARADDVLRMMASGGTLGALAFSERGTGAHFYSPELATARDNGRITISGRKSFVTAAENADVFLVLIQGEDEGSADIYLIERDRPGVSADGTWDGIGMTGNGSVAIDFDGVEVADRDRIGDAGQGAALVFGTVAPVFLVGLAAVNIGIAAAAANAATTHVAGRGYADGSKLAEVQYVQHTLADIDTTVRAAWLLVREAAALGDAGDESALVAIMEAKVAATEAASEVTELALQVTGGQGYTSSLPIERHLRDARAGTVMAPTNAVLRSWIGKALAGLPVP